MKSLEAAMREQPKKLVRRKEVKSEYLPEEVIAEILCRLPVKSILQCSCVCKSWYSLIKHPDFIAAHLQKTTLSSSNPNTNRCFLCDISDQYSLRFDNQEFEECMQFPHHSAYIDTFVAGPCNGVICLYRRYYDYEVVLFNPSIRKSISLPNFHFQGEAYCHSKFIALGYDSRSHDYKVLRILSPIDEPRQTNSRAELYSLNSNSWKDITQIAPKHVVCNCATGAVVNGSLYWIATQENNGQLRNMIMVFDVNNEIFHEILLPECIAGIDPSNLSVYQLRESEIAVVYRHGWFAYQSDIWVMKEYGVVESWVKLATVGKKWRGCSTVMGFRSNGDVLIAFKRGSLASQKLNSQRVKHLMALPKHEQYTFYSYVESLALLDKENNGDRNDASCSSDEKLSKTCR